MPLRTMRGAQQRIFTISSDRPCMAAHWTPMRYQVPRSASVRPCRPAEKRHLEFPCTLTVGGGGPTPGPARGCSFDVALHDHLELKRGSETASGDVPAATDFKSFMWAVFTPAASTPGGVPSAVPLNAPRLSP